MFGHCQAATRLSGDAARGWAAARRHVYNSMTQALSSLCVRMARAVGVPVLPVDGATLFICAAGPPGSYDPVRFRRSCLLQVRVEVPR